MSDNVYKRLQSARVALQGMPLNPSGQNPFAKYSYMELGDFIPQVNNLCLDHGLCGVVSFAETATLTIVNLDDPADKVVFSSPMSTADLKGCHPVQNLGAVHSYLRRYLWMAAFEIVEHDALDSTQGTTEEKAQVKGQQSRGATKPEQPKPDKAAAEKTTAEKLMDELADWCKGNEEAMEDALKQYSMFNDRFLTLQRLRSPDADPERRVKVMKWAGSTLGKIRDKREVKELCNECRPPMTGGKCVNQSCPNCEPF